MSTYLAIGGVTETLRALLKNVMDSENNAVMISVGPPDLEPGSDQKKRLNLYLYKIVENAYLKNQEIPGEGHPGAYGHPPLSLVLYYLLTAFPDDSNKYNQDYDLTVHKLLGHAMRVFHDYPILTDSMEVPPGSGIKLLHTSLQNQFEKLKITLMPLDTEELTKIWTGLTKPYRLSVGYAVSVVQIESKKPRQIAKPVKTRRLHTIQLRRPQITAISAKDLSNLTPIIPPAMARIGDELTIEGINFHSMATQVILGNVNIPVTSQSDTLLTLTIPDNPNIQPGVQTVAVTIRMAAEVVEGGYPGSGKTTSDTMSVTNQMALMIVPKITKINPPSGNTATILTVEGQRLFKEGLKTFILVGDRAIEVQKPGKKEDPWIPPEPTKVQVPLTALRGLLSGKYPIRIRVNGAENLEENQVFELPQGTLSFNGQGAHVVVPHSQSLRLERSMTVEAWVQMANLGNETWRCPIVSKHGTGSGWSLRTGLGHASFMVTVGSNHCQVETGDILSLNKWYHLAGTYDGNKLKIYVDGQLISTENVSGAIIQYDKELNIGRNPEWHDRCFNGEIDEVRVWNIARSQEEITGNMRCKLTGTETGLVGYWRFEEGSGTITKDLTPNHNDGKLRNGVKWSLNSEIGLVVR